MPKEQIAVVVILLAVTVGVHARGRTGSWLVQGNSSLAPWAWALGVSLMPPFFLLWYVFDAVRAGRVSQESGQVDVSDENPRS